jgi:hypothetical protein
VETALALALLLPLLLLANGSFLRFQRRVAVHCVGLEIPQLARTIEEFLGNGTAMPPENGEWLLTWFRDGEGRFSVKIIDSGEIFQKQIRIIPQDGGPALRCELRTDGLCYAFLVVPNGRAMGSADDPL